MIDEAGVLSWTRPIDDDGWRLIRNVVYSHFTLILRTGGNVQGAEMIPRRDLKAMGAKHANGFAASSEAGNR